MVFTFHVFRGLNLDIGRVWRLPGLAQRPILNAIDFSALEIAKFPGNSRNPEISLEIASTFSSALADFHGNFRTRFLPLADFRGNFRNSHFSLARRFPAEFPETYVRANGP